MKLTVIFKKLVRKLLIQNLYTSLRELIHQDFYRLLNARSKFYSTFFIITNFYKKKFFFLNKYTDKDFINDKKINDNTKKVILITGPLKLGGSERQIIKLAEQLTKKKYNVRICSLRGSEKLTTYTINKKIKVDNILVKENFPILKKYCQNHKLNKLNSFNFLNLYDRNRIFKLYDYLIKQRPDVVHAHLDFYCIITGIVGVILNINKIILSTRSMPPHNFIFYIKYFKAGYQSLIKFKNIVFVNNSKAGSRAYEKWLKFPKGTFKTTYNIYDFNQKLKVKKINYIKTKGEIILGSVLRLDVEKNPIYLLNLFFHLIRKNPNYKFFIIGNGTLKNKIKNLITKNNCDKKITLLSDLHNVHDYLFFFDIFILTSDLEGTPNVLLESQHVGTPVISTSAGGGALESMAIPYSAALISGKSYEKDARIIEKLIGNKSFIKKKNIKKIKDKLKYFLPYHSVKKIEQLYNKSKR